MRAVPLNQALPEGRWPKTSDLIVTGTCARRLAHPAEVDVIEVP